MVLVALGLGVLAVVVVVASLVRSNGGDSRETDEVVSAESEAFCEDGAGDVDARTFVGATEFIDITSATLTRRDGELSVRVSLDEQPPHDVDPNEGMSFHAYLYTEDGEELYELNLDVSHYALNDHDLEASGTEFGDAATLDELGFRVGVPMDGAVDGRIARDSVVFTVPLEALPQLPDRFFWAVGSGVDALQSSGGLAVASDACPAPYPSDADEVDITTWAAPSEGRTDGDGSTGSSTAMGDSSAATASTTDALTEGTPQELPGTFDGLGFPLPTPTTVVTATGSELVLHTPASTVEYWDAIDEFMHTVPAEHGWTIEDEQPPVGSTFGPSLTFVSESGGRIAVTWYSDAPGDFIAITLAIGA
ncbi:MAG: hypothetical protein KDB35_23060 [Acidimicrobiales bacterium]|nr:hypothetical protein [Acidimicrobiales bacterium]